MALKILDNFVLGVAGLRFHHRIQELTPHGRSATSRSGFRIWGPNARGHHGHSHLTPRNAQHRYCTLARPLSKRRDGHHKKALLTTAGEIPLMYPITGIAGRCARARRERPRDRRAAEKRDELPPLHSITSSASASSVSGTSRPRALAVLRLMTSWNFVDCITGKSADFSPLRVRPA